MFSVKKIWQLQLQVSNICHINNMFRTRSLSLMYCVNLAETSHTTVVADATQTIYPVPEANKHTVTTVQYYFNYTALNCITLSCMYTTAGHVHCIAYILA